MAAFRFLARMQRHEPLAGLNVHDAPRLKLRVLDHWDNPDRSIERGYAGQSIWDFWRLPGLPGSALPGLCARGCLHRHQWRVLNNVEREFGVSYPALDRESRGDGGVLRPYGIRVYLSVLFNSSLDLGETKTGDPRDPAVIAWWHAKADEIYRSIPDFGGFLVKADSEGQPGPRDYHLHPGAGREHDCRRPAPHGGVLMWRAFIYAPENTQDRVRQAYAEFKPLDGQFAPNVLVQIKNGPLDFQPREPAHPLFGALPQHQRNAGSAADQGISGLFNAPRVPGRAVLGSTALGYVCARRRLHRRARHRRLVDGHTLTGMAGVSNVGVDRDWTGSIFNQADWYAFGRLAWNPQGDPRQIASDWVRMTFSSDPQLVTPLVDMMMRSREAVVDYMTPLGLAHIMATGHHYGPGPWIDDLKRPNGTRCTTIMPARTASVLIAPRRGSDALADYAPEVARRLADPTTDDSKYLLWFHHVPWTFRLPPGAACGMNWSIATIAVCARCIRWRSMWDSLKPRIDPERFYETAAFLQVQQDGGPVVARCLHRLLPAAIAVCRCHPAPPPRRTRCPGMSIRSIRYAPGRSQPDPDHGIAH